MAFKQRVTLKFQSWNGKDELLGISEYEMDPFLFRNSNLYIANLKTRIC